MKYCTNCNTPLNDDASVCHVCGAQFNYFYSQNTPAYALNPYMQYGAGEYSDEYANGYAPDDSGEPEKKKSASLSIAAFITSLFIGPIGLILGIIALATKSAKKGLAIAAIILGTSATFATLIYVAIFVPSIVRYTEKSQVQSDTLLCNNVRIAISTAMMDPAVTNSPNNGIPTNDYWEPVKYIDEYSPFGRSVTEIMGYPPSQVESHLHSSYYNEKANGMQYKIENGQVSVRIEHSDSTGRKGRNGVSPIEVN
ncbi:MAG: hypothetical protein IKO32_09305 [Lachnospiraceae bacterium]|nr:hypothetical protein [Lachnospiraceae bacterium]